MSMRALSGGLAFALTTALIQFGSHAGAQELVPGPAIDLPPAVEPALSGECVSGGTNDLNGQLGFFAPFEIQQLCIPNPPEKPGSLKGFAFRLNACAAGGINDVAINFRIAEENDSFFLYIWRDLAGRPNDACGLEAYAALREVQDPGIFFSIYDLCDFQIQLEDNERFYVGTVYRVLNDLFLDPDWFIGRNTEPGFEDNAFINESGNHADWVDLNDQGFGNRWGVLVSISSTCGGPVPVEASSWGAVKALLR